MCEDRKRAICLLSREGFATRLCFVTNVVPVDNGPSSMTAGKLESGYFCEQFIVVSYLPMTFILFPAPFPLWKQRLPWCKNLQNDNFLKLNVGK